MVATCRQGHAGRDAQASWADFKEQFIHSETDSRIPLS